MKRCPVCEGSGRRPGSDYLDCGAPGCTAAQERATLESLVRSWGRIDQVELIWRVYQLGIEVNEGTKL